MRLALLLALASACSPPALTDAEDSDVEPPASVAVSAPEQVEVEVGTELVLLATVQGEATRVSWDLGDGARTDGSEARHTYTAPGNLLATVTAERADGQRASATVRVVAYLPAASPQVHASTPVVTDGVRVLAVEPDASVLLSVSLDGSNVVRVATCARPRSLAVRGDRVAVTCEGSDQLEIFELSTLESLGRIDLGTGARPFGVVPDGSAWMVTLQGTGALARTDGTGSVTKTPLGPDARALVRDAGGRAFASRLRARQAGGDVLTEEDPIPLPIDPGPDSDTGNRGVPTALRALAISPDGDTLYVGGTVANIARGLVYDGTPLGFDVTLRATVRVVDLATRTERFEERKQLDNHGTIDALALSPLGNWLWVAHAGTHTLERLDAYTLRAAGVILDAGQGIDGLALTPDGATLVVHAALDRELRLYDVADPSVPRPPLLRTLSTVESEPLAAEVLRGKQLFVDARDTRLGRDGYLSCDACHPDGRDDGLTWDFTQRGEGLRNTISLEGRAGTGMGPVHWTGNFDEIQDFENDIRNNQAGTGLLSASDWAEAMHPLQAPKAGRSVDLDALAAYVSSLAATPTSPYAAPEGGEARFVEAGCAACHDPTTQYTDSLTGVRHDVGTLRTTSGQRLGGPLDGLDTPTLLGSFATGPWLHDGSAPTLEAAIEAHDLPLAPEDVTELAAFVRSL